jgi:hypothetical protein
MNTELISALVWDVRLSGHTTPYMLFNEIRDVVAYGCNFIVALPTNADSVENKLTARRIQFSNRREFLWDPSMIYDIPAPLSPVA